MSDKENTPEDDFENDDFIEDEVEAVEKIASVSGEADAAGEDVDLSNIDNDFDDEDEFYGDNAPKNKWLNIVGIACFVLAGLVGVWQFWLSGVDKYEDKNTVAATVTPTPIVPVEPVSLVASDLPVIPVENSEAPLIPEILSEEDVAVIDEEVKTVDIDQEEAALPDSMPNHEHVENLPEVSVEMSEEEISDNELDLLENSEEVAVDVANSLVEENTAPVTDVIDDLSLAEETLEPLTEIPVEEISEGTSTPEDVIADAVEEEKIVEDAVEKVSEAITDTSEIVEKLTEADVAAALPKQEELKPIIEEEFVEEVETLVPDQVEYGSLTPAQILERAVVVRPKPKRIVVVKKNRSSTSSRSILVAADRSLKQGSLADALSLYEDVLSKTPKDTSALMGKALTLQKLNRTDKALEAYQRVIDIDPNHLNAMTNLLSLTQGDNTVSSINLLKKMETDNPKSAAIAGQLGMLYGEMKDVSNAARYFNKAQSLDPSNAVYPYNLAILSDRMGSTGKALEHYQKTMQLVARYGGQGVVSEHVVARRINELTASN